MEKEYARTVLGISAEASSTEIEAAYQKRIREVRKQFEAARSWKAQATLDDMFGEIDEARSCLLTEQESEPLPEPPLPEPPLPELPLPELPLPHPSLPEPPVVTLFAGRFELQRELGIGGMGAVWLAKDHKLKREIVLKFLPDFISRNRVTLDELNELTRRGVQLDHPNIAQIYDLVEDGGRVAISMEYVDGQSLSQFRLEKPNQVFEVNDLKIWAPELCGALEHGHKQANLVHGDVRPENLLIDTKGQLKLIGFGVARLISDSKIRMHSPDGTNRILKYSSPQQALGEKPRVTDDIYSVGASLYDLLTGTPPFYTGEIAIQIREKIPPSITERRTELGIKGEAIPETWEQTIAACLSKDPTKRPQSALELGELLVSPRPPNSGQNKIAPLPPPPPFWRNPLLLGTGAIFIVALSAVIAFLRWPHEPPPSASGRLFIKTNPSQANVLVDDTSRGTTPLILDGVPAGEHHLRIELEGYQSKYLSVTVKPGDTETPYIVYLNPVTPVPGPGPSASETATASVSPHPPSSTDRIRQFVDDYLRRKEHGDIAGLVAKYGEKVIYQVNGTLNRDQMRDEQRKYFDRWPIKNYEIIGEIDVRDTSAENVKEVRFAYKYEVMNTERRASGWAADTWLVSINGDQFFIVSEHETVHKNPE